MHYAVAPSKKFNRAQLDFLAHKIGKRQVKDDNYLDMLADALDGEEIDDLLSVSEYSDEEEEMEEEMIIEENQMDKVNEELIEEDEKKSEVSEK